MRLEFNILNKNLQRSIASLLVMIIALSIQAQTFMTSVNVYRVPYATGTIVLVSNDHWTHSPTGRIDMVAQSGSITIVAAADGTIEAIVDHHTQSCSDPTPCSCAPFNNYVWLRHENGEWTKYTHFQTGSVTDLGHQVGDFVTAGTALGLEGDIGCATGVHLHFEVAFPTTTMDPPFDPSGGGMLEGNAVNRIPVICNIPQNIFIENNLYVAAPCGGCNQSATYSDPSLQSGEVEVIIVDESIVTSGSTVMHSGSAAMFRAGNTILFNPGFHSHAGARFGALIRDCNEN